MDHRAGPYTPAQHPHHSHPPPPPPPPPTFSQQPQHHQQQQQPHLPQHQQPYHHQHPQASTYPPPQPSAPGPALPPIQHQPVAPSQGDQTQLPPFQHPHNTAQPASLPQPAYDAAREAREYQQYAQHNRSAHTTPAPLVTNTRSYSHDSAPPQRTPTTPAHPGPYPSSSGPDGAQLQSQQQQHPPQHPMEHGQHPGYPPPNGMPMHHGLPPPPPQHPPPTPHEQHQPYPDNPYGYAPQHQPPPMYHANYAGPTSSSMMAYAGAAKHKGLRTMRATQACEQCRARKQKCDEGNPCSFCRENSLSCTYRDTPPAKTDKNMEKITTLFEKVSEKIDSMDERLQRVEQLSSVQQTRLLPPPPPPPPRREEAALSPPPQEDIPRGKLGLADHRTAPHKLILHWPSVNILLKNAGVEEDDGYVMQLEDRGILRIFGRGEGIDEYDGTQPGGPASPAHSEEGSEPNPATPQDLGLWGFGFTPQSIDARRSEPHTTTLGGLKPDGTLDLDVNTIWSLYDSYMANMHIMHPFLDKKRTRVLFDVFIKRYSSGRTTNAWAIANSTESDRPLKRQRSNGSSNTTTMVNANDESIRRKPPILTERSPGNAIVYLVLALGKICAHKEPLQGIAAQGRLVANAAVSHQITGNSGLTASSPMSITVKPSPISPSSTPATHPTPLSAEVGNRGDSRSRRSSVDGGNLPTTPRNLEVVPGLAYYAKATEIMGDQGDGNDLVHAQMFLLAGLYKGQLARVRESMSWITMAGRALRQLLDRFKLFNDQYWSAYYDVEQVYARGQARITDKRKNLIVLASWTAIQLESDILAELPLPSSGIPLLEGLLTYPLQVPEGEDYDKLAPPSKIDGPTDIMMWYTAQMYVRRRLNTIHEDLYGAESLGKSPLLIEVMLREHERALSEWREKLPPNLQWDDQDAPAQDILAARLRAKYYGARYLINRPFLDYLVNIEGLLKDGHELERAAVTGHGNFRNKADVLIFKGIQRFTRREISDAAKKCIAAAMHSTVAFDSVKERLIVTNIHGTAHAQFGNMLVLSAVYHHQHTNSLVSEHKFRPLLERTIDFLRKLSPISPTCRTDCMILEKINRYLFPMPEGQEHVYRNEGIEPSSANQSFTSS